MGFDVQGWKWIRRSIGLSTFPRVATLGRQQSLLTAADWKRLALPGDCSRLGFVETPLGILANATSVEAIDFSSYEGATVIHDLNTPVPKELRRAYDLIIDGGCLEHVFDIRQAIQNCVDMCEIGGTIVHILPANNFVGHGFWQFSPDAFYSIYSPGNGFSDTEVVICRVGRFSTWFRVKNFYGQRRVNINSPSQLYVLVRTVRNEEGDTEIRPQQSDYVERQWSSESTANSQARWMALKARFYNARRLPFVDSLYVWMRYRSEMLWALNPGLDKLDD
jgi:hypothetical protein